MPRRPPGRVDGRRLSPGYLAQLEDHAAAANRRARRQEAARRRAAWTADAGRAPLRGIRPAAALESGA